MSGRLRDDSDTEIVVGVAFAEQTMIRAYVATNSVLHWHR